MNDCQLLPGNNERVLLACLRKRPWWHATPNNTAATTDSTTHEVVQLPSFIWEMYRNPNRCVCMCIYVVLVSMYVCMYLYIFFRYSSSLSIVSFDILYVLFRFTYVFL